MIMKPKAKKFCFKKLLVFGLIMVTLQVLTFAGDLPIDRETILETENETTIAILDEPKSEYAVLYSYQTENPLSTTFAHHESLLLGLVCVAAVVAANFRMKTVSKTVALGCGVFAVLNFLFFLAFALIDSLTWYNPYSLMECSPFMFGILVTVVGLVVGVIAYFSDPVIDMVTNKVEEKRRLVYEAERKAAREEELASEARKAAAAE